ncbi:MAG: beta-propeller fold lactonase family protein [Bauldia sp.]
MMLLRGRFGRTRPKVLLASSALLVGLGTLLSTTAVGQSPAYRLYVANEYGANISVIDPATDTVVTEIPISGRPGDVRPRGMAVSPDGSTIYVSISDFNPQFETPEDKIVAIDVATNTVTGEFRAGGNPERLAINPAGTQIWASLEAIAQGAGYDLATGELLASFRVGVEAEGVAVSPDGRWVYVTAEATHTTTVIDAENLTVVKHLLVGNRPRVVTFSPDGAFAYVTAEIGGTVSVIQTSDHTVVATIDLGLDSRPVEIAISPDGTRGYVAGGGTSAVYVFDTATNEVTTTIREQMGRRPWGITISADGSKVYTANGLSDSVSVIDTECLCVIDNIAVGRGAHSIVLGVAAQ